MTAPKSTIAALAAALVLVFAAPHIVPEADAASQQQTTKKKTKKKKPAVTTQKKNTNFRAARPDEYGRIFACDDFSLSIQPFCMDGHTPAFNVGGSGRGGMR